MISNKYLFTIKKNNITCNINFIKKKYSEIAILIETDSYNNFYSYSQKINKNNILNSNKKLKIDLLQYFKNEKVLIKEINNKEIIIEIKIGSDNYTMAKNSKELNFIKINHNEKNNNILYITIKRNEYYALWNNPSFKEKRNFKNGSLATLRNFCIEEANMVIYCISSIEDTLEFVKKRLNDKIIFITNIGEDYSGKRLIEIIREIYGFNIIVLFYSFGTNHFSWINHFPNCLYDDDGKIFKIYLTNYNKEDLKKLRIKNMEIKEYKDLSLKEFTDDFLDYSKIKKSINVPKIHFKIFNKKRNLYLFIPENGNIQYREKDNPDNCIWKITFLDNTITFYSNGKYLKDNSGKVEGSDYMTIWNFKKLNDNNYYFLNPRKNGNNILSIEDKKLKVIKSEIGEDEIFQLIEVKENQENVEKYLDIDNSFLIKSFLSQKIVDITDSKIVEDSYNSFNSSLLNASFSYSNAYSDNRDNFSNNF